MDGLPGPVGPPGNDETSNDCSLGGLGRRKIDVGCEAGDHLGE